MAVWFGATERKLQHSQFEYTSDPNVTSVSPTKSFLRCWTKGMAAWCGVGGSLQAQYWGRGFVGLYVGAVTPPLLVGGTPTQFLAGPGSRLHEWLSGCVAVEAVRFGSVARIWTWCRRRGSE